MPPFGLSSYSVLFSEYTILLHFLSEGFGIDDTCELIKGPRQKVDTGVGFLHWGSKTKFSCRLIYKRIFTSYWLFYIGWGFYSSS